jgi:hypothetical protein
MSELNVGLSNNGYAWNPELRQQAQDAEKKRLSGELPPPVQADWQKIRDDIRNASNPPAIGIEKISGTGILGFVTSYADESSAIAGATTLTLAAAEYAPALLQSANSNYVFGGMLLLQGTWVHAGWGPMKEAWKDLKESGICTSPTAKSFYEASARLTNNEGVQKAATYTGYWFWNALKEIPWWVSGGYVAPKALEGLSYDVDAKASMSVFLAGACLGSMAYQHAQYGIQKYIRSRREKNNQQES